MRVLGITGLKGCGKDTAAQAVLDEGFKRLALADPLREMLYALNPIIGCGKDGPDGTRWQDLLDAVGYDQAKKHPEVRRLMQTFGTEVIREQFGQEAWVDLAARKIRSEPGTRFVVTDVRFDNEAAMVHKLGGFVLKIERDGCVADGHASEAGVSEKYLDLIVANNGTVEDLHQQMRGVANLFGGLRRSL